MTVAESATLRWERLLSWPTSVTFSLERDAARQMTTYDTPRERLHEPNEDRNNSSESDDAYRRGPSSEQHFRVEIHSPIKAIYMFRRGARKVRVYWMLYPTKLLRPMISPI